MQYPKEFEEESLEIAKGLFTKDVEYLSDYYHHSKDSAADFEVVSAHQEENGDGIYILVNVIEELSNDDFEWDQWDEKFDFEGGRVVGRAQERLYRYLINSGQLSYAASKQSKIFKHCLYQQFRILGLNKIRFLRIYVSPYSCGGPDYFYVDDDLLDQNLYDEEGDGPQITYNGEDDYELSVEKVKIPIYITIGC